MNSPENHSDVLIIGAGISGLTCAAALRAAGLSPRVIEKSRGIGGRMATRRSGALSFDHGAQFLTAKSDAFRQYVARTVAAEAAAEWVPRGRPSDLPRYIGVPGMSAFVRPLAEGVDVTLATRATGLVRADDTWRIDVETGEDLTADIVVCTIPAPQAEVLLADLHGVAALAAVEVAPCWAVMLYTNSGPTPLPDALRPDTGPLAWIARNSSKPGRLAEPETWVLHATPEWSTQHLEASADWVIGELLNAASSLIDNPVAVEHVQAHRWRYAMTTSPLGQPFAALADGSVLAGGDWALGARVEAGYQSGLALAQEVIRRIKSSS